MARRRPQQIWILRLLCWLLAGAVLTACQSGTPTVSSGRAKEPLRAVSPAASPPITMVIETRPSDCLAASLTPSLDQVRTGPLMGAEQVVLLFRNTSSSACWLDGLPALSGIASSGRVVRLHFYATADPAYADPFPANGPGLLTPSSLGALHLDLQLNNCTKPGVRYDRLAITIRPGQTLTMPFPRQTGPIWLPWKRGTNRSRMQLRHLAADVRRSPLGATPRSAVRCEAVAQDPALGTHGSCGG
jgi:hypothetical protein